MTGVCLTINGREVVVDVDSEGACPDASTVDGRPVWLTEEQVASATAIADRRPDSPTRMSFREREAYNLSIPEVW